MSMPVEMSERVALVARCAVDEGRWTPDHPVRARLFDLERFAAIRIQAGQPALEEMNARLVSEAAADVLAAATAAMAAGLWGGPLPREIALLGAPPSPRAVADEPFGLFARAA